MDKKSGLLKNFSLLTGIDAKKKKEGSKSQNVSKRYILLKEFI